MLGVFFSYSHRDEVMRDELEVHLAALQRQKVISTWHDRRIGAGNDFAGTINDRLESADIILLLVSPYFIASDYCYDVEMSRAMERHERGEARVIPIILDPCDWHSLPFGALLATPIDGKPLSKFANIHDGFLEVTKAIREVVQQLSARHVPAHPTGQQDAKERTPTVVSGVRSSNLRITKEFTDRDRDSFLDESFNYIANFFENSLLELQSRNPDITTRFKRLSDARFTAYVYRSGKIASECCVRQYETLGKSITYSSAAASDNSFNESISVDDDSHSLMLKPMGMASFGRTGKDRLSQQGAAEYYWSILMRPLQRD